MSRGTGDGRHRRRTGGPAALLFPLAVFLVLVRPGLAFSEDERVALTVYSSARPGAIPLDVYRPLPPTDAVAAMRNLPLPGYAVVKQEREIELLASTAEVRFTDVAARIDPTTVRFESLTDPDGTRVLEQDYQYDLVRPARLMERYVGRSVTVEQVLGNQVAVVSGTLLSTAGGLVLLDPDGSVQVIREYARIVFPELPGGLLTKPALVWNVAAARAGRHRTRLTYQTDGITWWADYNVVLRDGEDANSGTLDLGAWVSLINQSGAAYPNARLKLVAGEVQRVAPQAAPYRPLGRAAVMEAAEAPGFEEKPFFEYHMYTLARPTTLPDNTTRQIELFPAVRDVPVEKALVYSGQLGIPYGTLRAPLTERGHGTQSDAKVDVYLRFRNTEDAGLGTPLPAGRIRVNKLDPADGTLDFIGEDTLEHTPRNEEVSVRLGSAFDLAGERRQVRFDVDTVRRSMEEEIEVLVRNRKDEAVRLIVREHPYRWVNWTIEKQSHEFRKVDARTVEFPVSVAADGQVTVRYTVRYTW